MRNITVNVETITPYSAAEYLKQNHNNRRISDKTVSFYKNQILKDEWQLTPEGISFDYRGRLLDGQHRLYAIIEANRPVKMIVSRGFDSEVFKVLNTGKVRNANDVLSINGVENSANISSMIKKYYAFKNRGLSAALSTSFKELSLSNTNVLEEYETNPELFQKLVNFARNKYMENKLLKIGYIGAVCAYLILNKLHSEEVVFNFFNELNGSSKTNAINLLRNKLITDKVSKAKLRESDITLYVAKAFNAYITGKDLKVLKIAENEKVEFI